MKIKCLYPAVVMLMLSCQSKQNVEENEVMACTSLSEPAACAPMQEMAKFVPPVIKDDEVEEDTPLNSPQKTNKKIIKDGEMSVKVTEIESAKKYMDEVLKKFDAYYEHEDFRNFDRGNSYNLKIRVPCKQFEKLLSATEKGGGKIMSKSINVRDVTEEYTDIEIRLSSKQLFRKRYYELLTKAAKVPDILAIEENIRTLQEEIESQEGRLKYMNDQITYSTLELNLFTEKEIMSEEENKTFGQQVKTSFKNGWAAVVTFVLWLMQQWPWLVLGAAFIFVISRWWKRRKK